MTTNPSKAACFMRRKRAYRVALLTLLVLGIAPDPKAHAQGNGPRVTTRNTENGLGREGPEADPQVQERMGVRRNSDRQKQLVADTDKLLLLAQELHDAVAKSNKDELSVPVMKRSEEIEKLAKSVKERMRGY